MRPGHGVNEPAVALALLPDSVLKVPAALYGAVI
jgi:hypothetical protein